MTSPVRPLVRKLEPWPHYGDEEVAAAAEVLRSGRVNQWTGDRVVAFEQEYAEHLGREHAIALMNGSVALELALLAAGVGEGDEVVTTPRTFIASAGAAVLVGATPVLADVDRDSGNITAETISRVLSARTRALIVVHLGGWPADMAAILDLARERGLVVIEDCAQAHGATIEGRPVGAFGDMAAFSFCQDKIITTGGEGGLLALDREDWFKWAWSHKDHGKGYDTVHSKTHPPGYRWLHDDFGTNWRMTEIQAALGRIQLRDLEDSVAARVRNAGLWKARLEHLDALRFPEPPASMRHAYYRLYGYFRPEALRAGWDRDRVQHELAEAGLWLTVGSCSEIYREEAFTRSGLAPSSPLPVARELGETSLAFPVHPTLSEDSIEEAAALVAAVVSQATR